MKAIPKKMADKGHLSLPISNFVFLVFWVIPSWWNTIQIPRNIKPVKRKVKLTQTLTNQLQTLLYWVLLFSTMKYWLLFGLFDDVIKPMKSKVKRTPILMHQSQTLLYWVLSCSTRKYWPHFSSICLMT